MDASTAHPPILPQTLPGLPHQKNNWSVIIAMVVVILVGVIIFSFYKFNLLNFTNRSQPQTSPRQNVSEIQVAPTQEKITLPCPLKDQDCSRADFLSQSVHVPDFQGLGYVNFPKGVEVVAIVSGSYRLIKEATLSAKETVNIVDPNKKLQLSYRIEGDIKLSSPSGSIFLGQTIGQLSGGTRGKIEVGKGYNLIIYIKDAISGKILKISPVTEGIVVEN